jgi:hypothetical protein
MGGGHSETRVQVRRAQDPGEAKAQESTEPTGRLIPLLSTTDSNEALDPEVDRCCRASALYVTGTRFPFAKETANGRGCKRPAARHNDNDRRGADAERRYGFVWRERL